MKKLIVILMLALPFAGQSQIVEGVGAAVEILGKAAKLANTAKYAKDIQELYGLIERLACQKEIYSIYSYHFESSLSADCFMKTQVFVMDYRLNFAERIIIVLLDNIVSDSETGETQKINTITEMCEMVNKLLADITALNISMQQKIIKKMVNKAIKKADKETALSSNSFNMFAK